MIADSDLRERAERALDWEPSIDLQHIAVVVDGGVVTLTGEADSYYEKWKAERTIEKIEGVKGIVNSLAVRQADELSDTDLARAAIDALRSNVLVPMDQVKVSVEDGWLTLEGHVTWEFQRRAAERAVRNLRGIRGLSNFINIRPEVEPMLIKERIEDSFKRQATLDASRVTIEVSGSEITLYGTVRSYEERRQAERAAWGFSGVTTVHNLITVDSTLVDM